MDDAKKLAQMSWTIIYIVFSGIIAYSIEDLWLQDILTWKGLIIFLLIDLIEAVSKLSKE